MVEYGGLVLRAGVRVCSCAEEFSLRPRNAAAAHALFHDETMVVGCRTRGELEREAAHRALDEWLQRAREPE